MFWNHKPRYPQQSSADRKRNEYRAIIAELGEAIQEWTYTVLVKKLVVDVYPEGADKDKARHDLLNAQEHLLSAIARYDDEYTQAENWIKAQEPTAFVAVQQSLACLDSHTVVENAVKDFYENY